MHQCHHSDTHHEGSAERGVLEGDVHGAAAELAVAEREWSEWVIARSRVGEVLALVDETEDHARHLMRLSTR
jgi:hypothetical protein